MIDKLIQFSIARRWLVMFLVLVTGALGVWNYQNLPIDAVPDITNVQVQINTEAPGYSPLEVEQRITYLVELAITGLPYVESTRSLSRYALSQVTVVFEKGTDIYFARNLINERLQQAKSEMPSGIEPVMGAPNAFHCFAYERIFHWVNDSLIVVPLTDGRQMEIQGSRVKRLSTG